MTTARLLIIGDESYGRSLTSAMLDTSAFTPVYASSNREAFNRLDRDEPYDLILSDLSGRGVDGNALIQRLRDEYPDIPIVLIAASEEVARAAPGAYDSAYDVLIKPLEKESVLRMLRRGVQYRRLIRQNVEYRQNLDQLVTARTEILNNAVADLERSYDITLEALGDALDLKDAETEGHSKRVTAFTIALARGLGLAPDRIRVIARGAFLHDIGKMAIPDAILLKAGQLELDEQRVMREHCSRGYQMLRKIPFLQEAAEIVYSHQEHFDGAGYPRGLRGEEIPLGARVFSVADTLDAITSDRPYRKARSFTAARAEIKRGSGTQFDPQVVEAYLSLPDQLWQDLRREITHHSKKFAPLTLATNKARNPFA